MSVEAVAARYAQALFEIGNEAGNLPQLADEVRRFGELYAENAELRSVLDNPLVPEPSRESIIDELAQRLGLGVITRNTVKLLSQRHRLIAVPYLARALNKLADERAGLVRAVVTTATSLSDSYYAQLKAQLEKSTGKKIVLETSVDPTILGGVITRIGDKVIDGSLRTRLSSMRESLLSG